MRKRRLTPSRYVVSKLVSPRRRAAKNGVSLTSRPTQRSGSGWCTTTCPDWSTTTSEAPRSENRVAPSLSQSTLSEAPITATISPRSSMIGDAMPSTGRPVIRLRMKSPTAKRRLSTALRKAMPCPTLSGWRNGTALHTSSPSARAMPMLEYCGRYAASSSASSAPHRGPAKSRISLDVRQGEQHLARALDDLFVRGRDLAGDSRCRLVDLCTPAHLVDVRPVGGQPENGREREHQQEPETHSQASQRDHPPTAFSLARPPGGGTRTAVSCTRSLRLTVAPAMRERRTAASSGRPCAISVTARSFACGGKFEYTKPSGGVSPRRRQDDLGFVRLSARSAAHLPRADDAGRRRVLRLGPPAGRRTGGE